MCGKLHAVVSYHQRLICFFKTPIKLLLEVNKRIAICLYISLRTCTYVQKMYICSKQRNDNKNVHVV